MGTCPALGWTRFFMSISIPFAHHVSFVHWASPDPSSFPLSIGLSLELGGNRFLTFPCLSVRLPAACGPRQVAIDGPCDEGDEKKIKKKDHQDFGIATTVGVAEAGKDGGKGCGNATTEEIIDDGSASCPGHHRGKPARHLLHPPHAVSLRDREEEIEEEHGERVLDEKQAGKNERAYQDRRPRRTRHKDIDWQGEHQQQSEKAKSPARPELIETMGHIAQEKGGQGHDGFIHVPPVGLKSQTTRTEAIGQGYGEKPCSGQPAHATATGGDKRGARRRPRRQ